MKETFKPLRNYLRQFQLLSFLAAVHHLSTHLDFGTPLPDYLVQANPWRKRDRLGLGFFLWELDTLAREAVLHCDRVAGKPVDRWPVVVKALNLLKRTEETALGGVNTHNVFSEVSRIAHRQFHWQQGVAHQDFIRTRMIYRDPRLNSVVKETYGLDAEQVIQGGFALVSTFMKYGAIVPAWAESASLMLGYDVAPILDNLSIDIPDLQARSRDQQALDADWAYTFHPLWLHPLVRVRDQQDRTLCPLPGLLMRRITSGLYFDIASRPDSLSRSLGPSYQAYVGRVLDAVNRDEFTIRGETQYGAKAARKDSVDWLVEDVTGVLFLECKVLKMQQVVRTKLAPEEAVADQFKRLATGIGQVYASLRDALAGAYPHWRPEGKPCYPLVVTLDNWNLFTHDTQRALRGFILEDLARRQVDAGLLEAHPYVVCSVQELETALQVMRDVGIHTVMEGLVTGETAGWQFSGYLQSKFPDALKGTSMLFPEDRSSLIRPLQSS